MLSPGADVPTDPARTHLQTWAAIRRTSAFLSARPPTDARPSSQRSSHRQAARRPTDPRVSTYRETRPDLQTARRPTDPKRPASVRQRSHDRMPWPTMRTPTRQSRYRPSTSPRYLLIPCSGSGRAWRRSSLPTRARTSSCLLSWSLPIVTQASSDRARELAYRLGASVP